MFERFTDQARRIVVSAQEEARLLNHNYIGSEHLLLALMRERNGVAARVLESFGITEEAVRRRVEELVGRGKRPPSGHIPFTPHAKKALELSLREALRLGRDHIGPEAILLGLIRSGDGPAAQVLGRLGADLGKIREQVSEVLRGYQGEDEPSPGGSAGFASAEGAGRPGGPGIFERLAAVVARLEAVEARLSALERQAAGGPAGEETG